jgi:hypothetical protein
MSIDLAIRLSGLILGLAILQQSLEFLRGSGVEKKLAWVRALLSVLLILNISPLWVSSALLITSLWLIQRFQGPYNGGSDTMTMLVLVCLWLFYLVGYLAPYFERPHVWQEFALGYLAIQLTLSYFQSGWVKVVNADWRSGKALCDVFAFTAYPVTRSLRTLAQKPRALFCASWIVILAELAFPLAFLNPTALIIALVCAACFHLANAVLFGLNRFVLAWIAAYPVALWFQQRLTAAL